MCFFPVVRLTIREPLVLLLDICYWKDTVVSFKLTHGSKGTMLKPKAEWVMFTAILP